MAIPTHQGRRAENGLGTAGLVLGIIAFVICLIPILGLVGTPLALVGIGLSIPGIIRARSGRATNFGSAVAGLVLSSLALMVSVVWFSIGMLAAQETQPASGKAPSSGGAAVGNAPPADGKGKAMRLGGTAVLDDFLGQGTASITVDRFNTKAKSNNEFLNPSPGNRFVAAHVVVKNTGKSTYTNVSWVGAKVYTKEGQAYDTNPIVESGVGRPLPSRVDLKPGGAVDGWLLFEVPADAKVASIVFDDAEWTL